MLNEYCRKVYHVIHQTMDFPKWDRPYPATHEYIQSLKKFLNINPKSTKFETYAV